MAKVEQCHPSAPIPYKTLTLAYSAVLASICLVPHDLAFKVTALLCAVTTTFTILNKVCIFFWQFYKKKNVNDKCLLSPPTTYLRFVLFQLNYRPIAVFLLAVASVILNTFAVGFYFSSFKYAVIVSPLICMAQAFLTLPFKIRVVQ